MSKTTILYKDVAPGADENAQVSASGIAEDSNLAEIPFGLTTEPVITLERNHWLLNGTFRFRDTQRFSFWSSTLSDDKGRFASAPVITVDFTNQYSSTGITLVFDRATGNYCSHVNIKWYQSGAVKADADFYPDAVTYFCKQTVTSYDKIEISLLETSLPGRYARVDQIVFGIHRQFGMSEIRSASVVNEMDGIAETLPVSTFKWTLDSREDVDFMFQLKQPVEIRNNDNLLGVYYIDDHKRKTSRIYDIECYDAIGVLDETNFPGGVYSNKSAKDILSEIIGEDFKIEFADDVSDFYLTGVITPGSKREAVQQVLFAWGVSLATDGTEKIRVFHLDDTATPIGEDRTFSGVSTNIASIVTEVRVAAHEYAENANGSIEIGGKKYSDTKTYYSVTNPDVTANDKQKVKTFESATLVSSSNVAVVAQRVYNWYQRRNTTNARVVWQGEGLGEYVSLPNLWEGHTEGNLTKMEIKLSNTVIASVTALG